MPYTSNSWLALVAAVDAIAVLWAGLFWTTHRKYRQIAASHNPSRHDTARLLLRMNLREVTLIGALAILSVAAFTVTWFATRDLLVSVQQNRFGPDDATAIVTGAGGIALGVGFGIAAIMKGYAKIIHAHADLIRARQEAEDNPKTKALSRPPRINKTLRSGNSRKALGRGFPRQDDISSLLGNPDPPPPD